MKQLTDYIYEYNSSILKSAIYEGINSNCKTLQELDNVRVKYLGNMKE